MTIGSVCPFASEAEDYLGEETIAAFAKKSFDVLNVLLVKLSLIAGTLAVLAALVRHGHGDLGEVA